MARAAKRKAVKLSTSDNTYESDEIHVAASTPSRSALRNVSVPNAQNKRRRIVDCVLIPTTREATKLLSDQQAFTAHSRRQQLTLSRTPSDSDSEDIHEKAGATTRPAFKQQTRLKASSTRRDLPDDATSSAPTFTGAGRTRPRRSAQYVPYVQRAEFSDDSADELAANEHSPKTTRTSTSKAARASSASSSSDYEDEPTIVVVESEDDYPSDEIETDQFEDFIEEVSKNDVLPQRKQHRPKGSTPAQGTSAAKPTRKASKEMKNLIRTSGGLDLTLPPLHTIDGIFSDLTWRALPLGLDKALDTLRKRQLRVASMCSGTESPLLALEMIQDALKTSVGSTFNVEHLFSAEIVPFKQAYIERNFNPPIIFRDIKELVDAVQDEVPMATTAYGGKVPVPTDIDIVIAGTSCVDFSIMNKHRKNITEGGESGDTWQAVLAFCKAFRPAIAILENVRFAQWDDMLQDYKDAGYEPAGAYTDTKDFYIPQTRQRGYMVCFDKTRLQKAGVSKAGDTWKTIMEKLQRRASSPVSSFLLPTDQITIRPLQTNENAKEVDWSKCEILQMSYRLTKHLGVSRPITHWSESGSMLPPEHGSRAWHNAQVERVLDTLDAAVLRKALKGYDARFKTRIWDVSQNIHRIADNNHFGIIGCITPSGINFVSDAWRAMTPEECLVLQGLPLDKISFTTETNADVQDLAGNAMSCPIVGAAILSGLIAGHRILGETAAKGTGFHRSRQTETTTELVSIDTIPVSATMDTAEIDILGLRAGAEAALRRCYCEGSHGLTENAIQVCIDCHHTTCIACGGNPEHNYRHSQELTGGRAPFSAFEESLRSALPLQLKLAEKPNRTVWPQHFELVRRLTRSTFGLSGMRRSDCIRVLYTAPGGRLELCLKESGACWYLYADAPWGLPSNADLRKALHFPVARMKVGSSLLGGTWEWQEPDKSLASMTISGAGERIPSWRARMQMPEFRDEWQWQFLEVSARSNPDICGRYRYLPQCGTACESLYQRVDPREDHPLYLFLDPSRVDPPDEDCFVFARDHSLLDYNETRQVLASVDKFWRPWSHEGENTLNTTRLRISSQRWSDHYQWPRFQEEFGLVVVDTDAVVDKAANLALTTQELSCRQAFVAVSASFDARTESPSHLREAEDGFISLEDRHFFSELAWVFEAMRRQLPTDEWINMLAHTDATCHDCAPERPPLRWRWHEGGGDSIEPYEDPRAAAMYERAVKQRQSPLLVRIDDGTTLSLGINLVSLAHRARARLPVTDSQVSYHWRLVTSQSSEPPSRRFQIQPTRNVQPADEDLHMSIDLFPTQRLALAWMREQEAGLGKEVMLEEAEEASLPRLGWRVEMRAEVSRYTKGGICADHPGFGKTITSLALVHSEWLKRGAKMLRQNLSASLRGDGADLVASSATVIVCPKMLVEQWRKEACDKWRSDDRVLVVKDAGSLATHSIEDFASAKLIVVSRQALNSTAYAERLAAFAAVPGPHTEKGRAYAEWLKHVTSKLPEHLAILKKSGLPALKKHLEKKYQETFRNADFQSYVPSKRLKGQAYVDSKAQTTKQPKTSKAPAGHLQTKLVGAPLFEMFVFNRIMIDEFHDYDAKDFEIITALKANKRWGLSGTPALGDCYDVAQIARLLGVPLRIGSMQRGFMKQRNIRSLQSQMTSFEKFHASIAAPSASQNGRIQELAQGFLDTFARRNVMDFDQLTIHQHLVPVNLSLVHHATYHELSQHLNSSNMKIRKSKKEKGTDKDKQLDDAVGNSLTAEEALSKSAAYPRRVDATKAALDHWIDKREAESTACSRELGPVLRDACKKEPEEYFGWKAARVDAEKLGDKETAAIVKDMCRQADSGRTSETAVASKKTISSESKRNFTSQANKLVTRLLTSRRSARYLRNVKKLQDLAANSKKKPSKCEDPECPSKLSSADHVAVSGLCGHLVCGDCFDRARAKKETRCHAAGCHASRENHHLLWNDRLGDINNTWHSAHGAKIDAALDILQNVRDKGEQAVVFVQYENQLHEVEDALRDRGIPAIVVKSANKAASQIAQFTKKNPNNMVIVLNASAETAAGLNLQNANHVLFLSPLLRDTQYAYESTMAQAIGRVRRHGQQKEIHVYRLVALNTIDVDILEHRERRIDALTEQDATPVEPPPAARELDMHDEPRAERTQLVKGEDGRLSLRPQSWLVRRRGRWSRGGGGWADGRTSAVWSSSRGRLLRMMSRVRRDEQGAAAWEL